MSTSLIEAESGESYAVVNERTLEYVNTQIDARRSNVLNKAAIDTNTLPHFEKLYEGKVRDMYICRDVVVIVTTDRQSAFDRQLAEVPFKGRVLNLLALWWFEKSHRLIPNHVIASPHPNVTVGRRCDVFMVEFVMRAYITGHPSFLDELLQPTNEQLSYYRVNLDVYVDKLRERCAFVLWTRAP